MSAVAECSVPAVPIAVSEATDGAQWDAFIARHPEGTVEHLWFWRDIFRDVFGHDSSYLAASQDGKIIGALPLVHLKSLLFGRLLISLPFANYAGLVASDEQAARRLVERAAEIGRTFGAKYVEMRNVSAHLPELPSRHHKVGARLALPDSSERLFAQIDRKVRNLIRKAQKEGVTVERGGVELVDPFYDVFAQNMRDLGTPVFPRALFAETLRRFDGAQCFIARAGGRAIAGAIALSWRDAVLVPWASSLREARHLNGNMLVYWAMLEAAIAEGRRTFDFGRSSAGGGTHRFKQQWGAADFPLHWEYVRLGDAPVPDGDGQSAAMARAIELWKRLPLPVSRALGPHLTRHIS